MTLHTSGTRFSGELAEDGGTNIFKTGDLASSGTLIFDGIVCRNEFKEKHPDLAVAYLKEIDRIKGIYRSNSEQVADVMAPFLQIPRETVLTVVRTTHTISPKEMLEDTWMGMPGAKESGILRAIRTTADFLQSTGQLDSVPADFLPFVDSKFVAKMV